MRNKIKQIISGPTESSTDAHNVSSVTPSPSSQSVLSSPSDFPKNSNAISPSDLSSTLSKPQPKRSLTIPETYDELVEIISKAPKSLLTSTDKRRIISSLNYQQILAKDLMVKKNEITFLKEDDFLGPILLDKLHQSGLSEFPVVDKDGHVVGILPTKSLSNLEIKEEVSAKTLMVEKVFYVREDYPITMCISAALRNKSHYFIVCDKFKRVIGVISLDIILSLILWQDFEEDFHCDDNLERVSRRLIKK